MKYLALNKLLILVMVLLLSTGFSGARYIADNKEEADSFTYFGTSRTVSREIIQTGKVHKAQKKQDAKKRKEKKAIKDGSKKAQKRSYEIQSPEVKERMKQNKKDTKVRDKARKKSNQSGTKKAGKKYK